MDRKCPDSRGSISKSKFYAALLCLVIVDWFVFGVSYEWDVRLGICGFGVVLVFDWLLDIWPTIRDGEASMISSVWRRACLDGGWLVCVGEREKDDRMKKSTWFLLACIIIIVCCSFVFVTQEESSEKEYTIAESYVYPVIPGTPEWNDFDTVYEMREACQIPNETTG